MPGVVSIAETYTTPLGGSFSDTDIEIDHKFVGNANVNRVSPGYFATLGTRMLAGRDFDERDAPRLDDGGDRHASRSRTT